MTPLPGKLRKGAPIADRTGNVLACLLSTVLLLTCGAATANDLRLFGEMTQEEFRELSEDLGGMTSYKGLATAEPGPGLGGFKLGVDASQTRLANPEAWERATGESSDAILGARLRGSMGLPLGFDVAGFYTNVPDSNVSVYGAEVRYSLVEGGVAVPAVQVRGGFSEISGVGDFDYSTRHLDMVFSREFGIATPYLGAGRVWSDSEHHGEHPILDDGLERERFHQDRYFGGAVLSLALVDLALEYERVGSTNTLSTRVGFSL